MVNPQQQSPRKIKRTQAIPHYNTKKGSKSHRRNRNRARQSPAVDNMRAHAIFTLQKTPFHKNPEPKTTYDRRTKWETEKVKEKEAKKTT